MVTDDRTPKDDFIPGRKPPFQFNFQVFCPWATSVQVLVHPPSDPHGQPIVVELTLMEESQWCGEIDLPGKDHVFTYRCIGTDRTVVAPFEGSYSPPNTYAKMSSKATYYGRPKLGRLCG